MFAILDCEIFIMPVYALLFVDTLILTPQISLTTSLVSLKSFHNPSMCLRSWSFYPLFCPWDLSKFWGRNLLYGGLNCNTSIFVLIRFCLYVNIIIVFVIYCTSFALEIIYFRNIIILIEFLHLSLCKLFKYVEMIWNRNFTVFW